VCFCCRIMVSPVQAPRAEVMREGGLVLVEHFLGTTPKCTEETVQGGLVRHHSAAAGIATTYSATNGVASLRGAVEARM